MGRSTLYGHLVILSAKRVLRYTTVRVGRVRTFVFELLMGTQTGLAQPWGMAPRGRHTPDSLNEEEQQAVEEVLSV